MEGDTPYHRRTVAEMSRPELEAHVTMLRERRMLVRQRLQQALELNKQVKLEKVMVMVNKAIAALDKELGTMDKCLARIDKKMEKLDELSLVVTRMAT